jgi:hypothetical protein
MVRIKTLKEDYLSLFVSSLAKDVVVAYMGSWNEGGWAGCGISYGTGKCHLMSGLKLRSLESYLELIWRIGDDGYIPEPTCIFFD